VREGRKKDEERRKAFTKEGGRKQWRTGGRKGYEEGRKQKGGRIKERIHKGRGKEAID
jgi:hypothetical protein